MNNFKIDRCFVINSTKCDCCGKFLKFKHMWVVKEHDYLNYFCKSCYPTKDSLTERLISLNYKWF